LGGAWVEQAVQVDDEVAHLRVVHRLLCAPFPDRMSGGVIGINADDVELRQILEREVFDARQLAPENKVQELFFIVLGHVTPIPARVLAGRTVHRHRTRPKRCHDLDQTRMHLP